MEEKNQNNDPILNGQTSNPNIGSSENIKKKGKGPIILLIIAIILILAIVAGLVYYFTIYTKPDKIYKRLIGSTIDSYTEELEDIEYKTSKTYFKLDADLDTDEIDESIKDLINKINLGLEVQMDNEEKQLLMNLEADYENEDLIAAQMYSNIEEQKTYIQLKDLFDKYIEVEDLDEEYYSTMKELFESSKKTNGEKESLKTASKIIKKELTNVIKEEYCSAQKEEITINGKTVNATKNILKMNAEQFKNETITVLKNLKDNEEFINCFEEKEKISKILEDSLEQLEDSDVDDEATIEIAIYTEGFLKKATKFTLSIQESDEVATMAFTKKDKNTYDFEFLAQEKNILTGLITLEEKNKKEGLVKLEINVPDFGTLKLNIEYGQKYNEDIESIDTSNSIKISEITKEQQETLLSNFEKSKLYELISSYAGAKSNLLENISTNEIEEPTEEYEQLFEETTDTGDNEILSYDNKLKIIFKIPQGYELGYASDNYKSLEKGDSSIKISSSYGDKDSYYQELQEEQAYYEGESNYKNVQLSDMQTMEVNGKTFYYATFSYEYSVASYDTKYETIYIWSEISDKYIICYEIDEDEGVTEEELNAMLTIEVEENR